MSFPLTHASLLERTQSGDPEIRARAHETLAAVYWGPVYAYVRLTHGAEREDAEDREAERGADVNCMTED